jgi:hypothetical protein
MGHDLCHPVRSLAPAADRDVLVHDTAPADLWSFIWIIGGDRQPSPAAHATGLLCRRGARVDVVGQHGSAAPER